MAKGKKHTHASVFNKSDDWVKELSVAIVEQAIFEYKTLRKCRNRVAREIERESLERFFYSDWCNTLCGIDKSIWENFLKEYDYRKKRKKKADK